MEFKEAFIFVAGVTPQIITETLYALHNRSPRIAPDEVFVITTSVGREKIERLLIEEGRLDAFYRETGMNRAPLRFAVVSDNEGTPLDDIRTAGDNELVGDFIVNFIKERTMDPKTRLHCSIAGGRKTMSFYLGSALSLFGRPWDRLYHVLVTPEFESHPDFYWIPAKERVLDVRGPDGTVTKRLNTKDAEIFLAELPFIRLRDGFDLDGRSFRELVREGQREIETATAQLPLVLNLAERTVSIGPTVIEMVPMQLVIYNAFLREKLLRCRYPERPCCLDCTDCFPFLVDLSNRRVLEEMASDYRRAYGSNTLRAEYLLERWPEGIDVDTLRQHVSKINRTIKEHLGDGPLASFYTVTAVGRHGRKRHGVKVEKGKVKVVQP